jgi:hypothetical protein
MSASQHDLDDGSGGDHEAFARLADANLRLLGLEASPQELAVIRGADALYRPLVDRLFAADVDEVEPEGAFDPSRPPLD